MRHVKMQYDAIVIGAGPAGSTAAAVLAEKGRRVLVIEREKFPRYSVGESLIPYCYFPLKRIGLIEKMKASHFPAKHSVQFVSRDGKLFYVVELDETRWQSDRLHVVLNWFADLSHVEAEVSARQGVRN